LKVFDILIKRHFKLFRYFKIGGVNLNYIDDRITRRSFVDYLLGIGVVGSIISVLYPIIEFMIPPQVSEAEQSAVSAGKISELPLNSGKIFKFGSKPGILIRTQSGELKAFSAVCTHLDCTVQYRDDQKMIWCACHNGLYDLNGKNVSGPPPRPLEEFNVNVRGDEIIITKRI